MSAISEDFKSYRTSGILFLVAAVVFFLSGVFEGSGTPAVLGIIFFIVGVGVLRRSRKMRKNEQNTPR